MNQHREARAVLWDVDGTLLDSREYHWLSWREVLLAEGYPLTYEEFLASFGRRNDEILPLYFGSDMSSADIDRISLSKEARYRALMQEGGVQPLPGVREWLQQLHETGWRQAVASSAPLLNVQAILKVLEIESFFEVVTSAEDVQRGKPDPQVFLVTAQKLGVAPKQCVVVEDAHVGIEAARQAGMRAIGVLSSHANLDGDIVVQTLDQLPADAFDRLLHTKAT